MTEVIQTIVSALVPLASVALGGILTLNATRSSQARQIERDKDQRRSEKFEELVLAIFELENWRDRKKSSYTARPYPIQV